MTHGTRRVSCAQGIVAGASPGKTGMPWSTVQILASDEFEEVVLVPLSGCGESHFYSPSLDTKGFGFGFM